MSENLVKEKDSSNEQNLQMSLIEIKKDNQNNEEINQNRQIKEENKALSTSSKNIESIKSISYVISRRIRWILFLIFIFINILMNFDHGTIPAATDQLRSYLDLTDSELGFFGSLVFVGVIIGSLVSLTIINIFNRKYILMVCLILCGLSLFVFTITTNYILLCIDRVIIGTFQAFISIYLPLWCDQFGVETRKALMLALIQVAPPLGVLVGYIVTTILNMYLSYLPYFGDIEENERWLYSFYIQSFLIWGLAICLLLFPDKFFNSKARRVPLEIEETLNEVEKENRENQEKRRLSFFYEGSHNFELDEKQCNSPSISEKDESEDDKRETELKDLDKKNEEITAEIKKSNSNDKRENNCNDEKMEKINNEKNSNKNQNEIPFLEKLKIIFSEPLFICSILTLSILFFIVTCVQYWTSDYMLIALEVEDETKRLYAFSIVCLTSPTCGLLIGGYFVDYLGGYSNKNSLLFCLLFAILSLIPAILLPLVNSYYLYAILLWILLFFGSGLLPTLQGIIIACLPKNIQGSGNSFVIFFYNLLGYLPAPFVYGFFKEYFEDKNDPKKGSRAAQKICTWITFLAPILIGIATIFRFMRDEEYSMKMGRQRSKSKIIEENEVNPIRDRESSLDPNKKQDNESKKDKNKNNDKVNEAKKISDDKNENIENDFEIKLKENNFDEENNNNYEE